MSELLPTEEQVGAHHCEPGAIKALLDDLDAIGECRESPPLVDRDHRARAGVIACVIRHLQSVGARLVVEKGNLLGELREEQRKVAQLNIEVVAAYEDGYDEGLADAEGALP